MLKMFESRNKKISDLIKLGDFIGYSIRENIQLFSVDGLENKVSYLTESNNIISGYYSIKSNNYILENIEIKSSDVFTNGERFDEGVSNQISVLLENLYNDDHNEAESSFTDVVDILTSRTHYNTIHEKLQKKTQVFNSSHNIMESEEFNRFVEIIPELIEFLSENKEAVIERVPEVTNSLKLSESVSEAFAVPKIAIEQLQESGRFEHLDDSKKSIYEMICKQELVKKELLEAKNSFDVVWASEPVIDVLASKVYASDVEVEKALTEALKELPYLALVSKKKLFETISRNLGHSNDHISEKEIKSYVSQLFEMKKPAKEQLTSLLGEKYGINLQYLKESYSFKSLLNTQVVLFESISRITPNGSVLKQILSEFSSHLKAKNGVQSLDINNIIQQIFEHAGYSTENIPLMESFSFNDVKKAFEKAEILVEKKEKTSKKEEDDKSEKEEEEESKLDTKKEEKDKEEAKESSEDVQEEEVATDEEESENTPLTDAELMKAIKDLSDVVNGPQTDEEEL
jgi:hypothetical protein